MREFNLEEAKLGKPIMTRDGRKAVILCFDRNSYRHPLVVIVDGFLIICYTKEGKNSSNNPELDLFMKPGETLKKEGWINIYTVKGNDRKPGRIIYESKEEGKIRSEDPGYITTVKIKWKEEGGA